MPETIVPQILIVDDARDIREPLGQYLRKQGFRTQIAHDIAQARTILAQSTIHLVISEAALPGGNGLALCTELTTGSRIPLILLSACDSLQDRIDAIEGGADDYVTKPFDPRELVARIRAVLRRAPPEVAPLAMPKRVFDNIIHDAANQTITRAHGEVVALTTGENRLLTVLLDHPGEVLSRMRLLDQIRGREAKAYDRAVDNAISRLRRKIGDEVRMPRLIVTEWGGGYRLAVPVDAIA